MVAIAQRKLLESLDAKFFGKNVDFGVTEKAMIVPFASMFILSGIDSGKCDSLG